MDGPRRMFVSGLVWQMQGSGYLVGPAIGAALGAIAAGGRPEMIVATSTSVREPGDRLLRTIDPAGRHVRRLPLPMPVWSAPRVLANTGAWTLTGEPTRWFGELCPGTADESILVIANGSPLAALALLERNSPALVAMDIDGSWAASQGSEIRRCAQRAHLVTITATDYAQLRRTVLLGCRLGARGGAPLVLKCGDEGICILAEGAETKLPPPRLRGGVTTDVGAGDVLLGYLASWLGGAEAPLSQDALVEAYTSACSVLAELLVSQSFDAFARDVLGLNDAD